jgi:Uma2 family endonuclease
MALTAEKLSMADYLVWENQQSTRHEFYRGEVFAMVGVRRVHGLVVLNLALAIKSQLKGSGCQVFSESLKLQVADDAIFYPDLFVTCDPADLKTDMVFRKPTLIVEVLSESTQAYDRGLKYAAYRRLDSLREYVLVHPDTRRIEIFRRNQSGLFEIHDPAESEDLHLASIDLRVPMADVFDGMESPGA